MVDKEMKAEMARTMLRQFAGVLANNAQLLAEVVSDPEKKHFAYRCLGYVEDDCKRVRFLLDKRVSEQ
jgi:hypothetical protein